MKKQLFILVTVALALGLVVCQAEAEIKIGVLAKSGPLKAIEQWGPTGTYLTKQLGERVSIVPLGFNDVFPVVSSNRVDLFLVNPSMFMTAKIKYSAAPVATMINSRQGKALSSFGGVIFTKEDNNEINNLADLKGKKFGAVSQTSFGGFEMAQKEMLDQGIHMYSDFATLRFFNKHEAVVKAVLSGSVDAGTVRTDTLERMAMLGRVNMTKVKILARKNHYDFPFVCSTILYPEWPLAKTANTDFMVANRVVTALKLLTENDQACKEAKIIGWTDPLDYSSVEELQRDLKVGGYQ